MSDHPQPPPKRSRKLSKPTTAPTIMVWPDLPNPPIPCGMSTEKTHTAPEVFVKQKRSGTSHKEEDGKREDVTGSEELSTNAERITEIGIPHQNTEEADTSRPIPVTTPPKSPLIFAYVQPPIPSNVQPSSKRPSIIVPSNGPEFSVDTILSRIVHSSPELKEEISPIPTSQTVPEKTKSQTSAPQMTKQIDTSPDANIWIVANDKGYRMAKSTHGFTEGTYGYSFKWNGTGNVRMGVGQMSADLQGPVGCDEWSYSWRATGGTFHQSRQQLDIENGITGGYEPGDIVTVVIHMPPFARPDFLPKPLVRLPISLQPIPTPVDIPSVPGSWACAFVNNQWRGYLAENLTVGKWFVAASCFGSAQVEIDLARDFTQLQEATIPEVGLVKWKMFVEIESDPVEPMKEEQLPENLDTKSGKVSTEPILPTMPRVKQIWRSGEEANIPHENTFQPIHSHGSMEIDIHTVKAEAS